MDKIKKYQKIVEEVLKTRLAFPSKQFPNLKDTLIIDEMKQHFMLVTFGWDKQDYIHQILFHIEVKLNGQIWIHENRTDLLIDKLLIAKKISDKDIISGMIDFYSIEETNAQAA